MKFKFTKLAALLLAGAALLASGCTDYEVDIQKANQRIDQLSTELNNQVEALKTLLQTTYETIANHDADVQKLEKADKDLKDLIDALDLKKLDKSEYQKLLDAIAAAKAKLTALEYADEDFVNQVADLLVKMDNAIKTNAHNINEITKEGGLLDQYLAQAKSYTDGEIAKLEIRVKKNEDALKELNEVVIPAIKSRLDELEALTDGGEEGWKDADGNPVTIKQYIDGNVTVIWNAIKALQKLTAGDWKVDGKDATIKEYVDHADQLLDTKIFSVIAKAFGTEEKMDEMKGTLLGRIESLEALTAGFPEGVTIKQYIDAEVVKLQNQIDALDARVDVIDDALAFCKKENADGTYSYDLKGEFDKVNERIDAVIEWATELFSDIYDKLYSALSRIQSIQYVPDYDDLKITTNVALYTQPGMEEGEVVLIDQPTKLTYQFLPAQYASAIAAEIKKNIIAYGDYPWTYEQLKNTNFTDKLIAYFNVKPVNTRAEEAPAAEPGFKIIGIDKVDDTTGEITFVVQPVNVATATYLANGLKPRYDLDLIFEGYDEDTVLYNGYLYNSGYGGYYEDWILAAKWDDDLHDFVETWPVYGQDPNNPQYDATSIAIWDYQDLMQYQARTNYAAQLVLYKKEAIVEEDTESIEFTGVDYENHLASPYNVLYPHTFDMSIEPDPYKKLDDDSVRPFTEDEIWQTLPYSSLREGGVDADGNTVVPNIGEQPEQDPKGYRVILDQAVPAVVVDGKEPMTIEAALKAGYNVPAFKTTFKEFTYVDAAGEELSAAKKENFVETNKVYAEIEMNPKKLASSRKLEVGDLITGTYDFTSALGAFSAEGYVTITKPQGKVLVSADINWEYAQDADQDHAVYYEGAAKLYSHDDEPVAIDEESAKVLEQTLGITLADFSHKTPDTVTIKDSEGNAANVAITDVKIVEGALFADFADFKWDETYTVTAEYELDAAIVIVEGKVKTTDRDRTMMTVDLGSYPFVLNGPDYDADSDTYTSKTKEFQQNLFDLFVAQKIINQATPKDYADATAFIGVETNGKEGHLEVVPTAKLDEGEVNSAFIVIADDNATLVLTSPQLKANMDKAQTIYVTTYIGQKVEVVWTPTVDLPDYDFLHLTYYTFNTKESNGDFIQKRTYYKYKETDPVIWWTQVNPSYFTGTYNAQQEKVSYRHALKQYDVAYINLAELAFNVVDEKDVPISDERIAAEKIVVDFDYATINPQKALPTVDQITGAYEKYVNLWVTEHPTTVFYYRTNEEPYIQAYGKLGIKSGDTVFDLKTRFDRDKAPVAYPDMTKFNYKDYYMVRWTPFEDGVAEDFDIVLDENKIYREPLFKKMSLKDRRPNGVSYDVIKGGEWVVGNVTTFDPESSTPPTGGNGYIKDVAANTAYDIKTTFTYDDLKLPVNLRKLLSVKYYDAATNAFVDEQNADETLVPYIVYDYTSEVQFQGVVTIPVAVRLENPWQETITFDYKINIKGYND